MPRWRSPSNPTRTLKPGESLDTFPTFVAAHQGDYFQALKDYSAAMQHRGVKFIPAPDSAFGAIWCAWGYGKAFTPAQVENALPIVKKLGFSWVGVDDGWQTNEGDWALLPVQIPEWRPRYAGAGRQDPRSGLPRATLVGASRD